MSIPNQLPRGGRAKNVASPAPPLNIGYASIEVKDRKTKVTVADAEKFVRAVKTVKQHENLPVVALYLDTQGQFAKNAAELLERCCILFGKVEDFVK
jgi:hypothetical protein